MTVRNAAQSFDELGEPTGETVTETTVDNVVVCPGATADLDSTRPNGVTVTVRGTDYKVVGDPKRYTAANTPGPWDLTCEVTRTDG